MSRAVLVFPVILAWLISIAGCGIRVTSAPPPIPKRLNVGMIAPLDEAWIRSVKRMPKRLPLLT